MQQSCSSSLGEPDESVSLLRSCHRIDKVYRSNNGRVELFVPARTKATLSLSVFGLLASSHQPQARCNVVDVLLDISRYVIPEELVTEVPFMERNTHSEQAVVTLPVGVCSHA